MSHHGGEDLALPVGNPPDHRLVGTRPPFGLGRKRRGQDVHVQRRTTLPVVQLVAEMHPLGRDPRHHRVAAVTNDNREGVLRAVTGTRPFALGRADRLAGLVQSHPFTVTGPPPAQADHLVPFAPLRKRVVGRVDDHQPATAGDVLLQRRLDGLGPRLTVVVGQHHIIGCKVRPELGPVGLFAVPCR